MKDRYIIIYYKIKGELYPISEKNRRVCEIRVKEKALGLGTTEYTELFMQTQSEFMGEMIK